MIEVRNVNKSFGGNQILFDINATFEQGKVNLIIGQSGSGKSVLAKSIVGLHVPETGEILFDGRNFLNMTRVEKTEVRKEIGMLFQGSALFDSMTVEENVMFPLKMFTNKTSKEMLDRANFCLERVNLTGKNKLYPAECSGGMQKRIAIARAIAMQPKYLFCDEPNSGLDPKTSIVIDGLIKEITYEYNMTTIVITHDMNSVIEIGDRVLFIHQGKKWWEGDRKSILTTDNQEIIDFVYASNFMKEIRENMQKK
ncbi:ATP-binding cassette domain-containing protein [Crocinitomicaceae bacterium CZZ-1]|uniref:ATP-binding cassette domain-containing protein n=1 Tax=Taishania pollutisoli TaxID=2766479 RepID=A0A8J6PFS0_9FLAO|nr:ATP-binding cassette domain-containing protein [Taishania pollutisoli]MBC9813640.1 ATP-binding cassette domain-containing protein [Taishania pollutisoli]MBX2948613.1 ATP-binding cassette domain-containing protein [Crocinitomicaceae bacterium]NGF75582.1 ATP-binding cassette domain-containing protein [Fluviicola sp. SGL-29]